MFPFTKYYNLNFSLKWIMINFVSFKICSGCANEKLQEHKPTSQNTEFHPYARQENATELPKQPLRSRCHYWGNTFHSLSFNSYITNQFQPTQELKLFSEKRCFDSFQLYLNLTFCCHLHWCIFLFLHLLPSAFYPSSFNYYSYIDFAKFLAYIQVSLVIST